MEFVAHVDTKCLEGETCKKSVPDSLSLPIKILLFKVSICMGVSSL